MTIINYFAACPNKPADIAFVIDESSSIWGPHFQIMIQFVSNLIGNFDVGPEKTRFAAVTFAEKVTHRFSLDDFNNTTDVTAAVMGIDRKVGRSKEFTSQVAIVWLALVSCHCKVTPLLFLSLKPFGELIKIVRKSVSANLTTHFPINT